MRTLMSVVLSAAVLSACQPADLPTAWDDTRAMRYPECPVPTGPLDFSDLDQGLQATNASTFAYIGDTPVIDGTSIVMGGLYDVQFWELDPAGTYQPTTFLEGPSGYAFGRELTMSDGHALIGETNFQEPGQSSLTGRVRAYTRDETGHWSLDPITPYITASDLGLVTGSAHIGVGYNLQMDGDTAVIGVQRADDVGATPKSVLTRSEANGWELVRQWPGSDAGPVAIAGDYIAFARRASFDVLVYKREGGVWGTSPVATIPRPAAGSSQYARCSNCVKFDGDRLIVGDIYLNGQRGGAFVFQRQAGSESFSLAQTITPAGSTNDLHGFTLETEHERLYVGSATARSVGIYEFDQGQYVLRDTLTDTIDSGLGRGLSADGSRLLVGRGRAARIEGVSADRGRLYVSEGGVFDVCDVTPDCVVGTPFDWDGDGEDDGCRGTDVYIDASVTIPAGTQVGDDVQVLAGAAMGSGNILRDGSLLGVRASIGDDNDLGPGSIIGRRSMVGSRNALLAETVTSRAVVIGDDNRIGGSIGYAAELGNNLDLPNATIGSLVIIGAPATPAGRIDCPGPLVVARSTVIAEDPANGFTCTGTVVIGPESVVEGAVVQSAIRLRKRVFLGATVVMGTGARVGRAAVVEGGVTLDSGALVSADVRVCDAVNAVGGRLERGYVDPTCP